MKKTVLVLVVLAVFICTAAVWGQGGPRRGGPPPGPPICAAMAVMPPHAPMVDAIGPALQLTTDQVTGLKEILTTSDATILPLVKTAADKSKALRDAVLVPKSQYDQTTVDKLTKEAQTAEAAVLTAGISTWTAIRSSGILTDDQLAKFMAGPVGPPPGGPPPGGGPPPPGN